MIIRRMLEERSDSKFIPSSLRSGVDMIRDEIIGFCEAGGFRELKLIIFDEADRLSADAQGMMRNVMDRYNGDVRFIFTCNHPDRILEAVKGRMWTVEIQALDEEQFTDRLMEIALLEDVDILSDDSTTRLLEIVQQNYPNMRHAISELQRSSRTTKSGLAAVQALKAWVNSEQPKQKSSARLTFIDKIRTQTSKYRSQKNTRLFKEKHGSFQSARLFMGPYKSAIRSFDPLY
jgi:DNA polymerase III delta prime subunit